MTTLHLIKTRRSIRKFKSCAVPKRAVEKILEAGLWAPSGLNNQPWRFLVLSNERKNELAQFTHYSYIVKGADKVILVFLDKKTSYNYEKDLMAIGACIQNMLLYIHSIKLGACWLGEILNKRDRINALFGLPDSLQLEAVLAIGKPLSVANIAKRKKTKELLICEKKS